MAGIKGLLARVRKLEPQQGCATRRIGSLEKFQADCEAGIKDGRYAPVDMRDVMYCIRQWVEQGL